ncbi:YpmS family protein [Lentilactobacillus senioris]|uniref:YpmS family protein n=1 Tax=Lentilactobacillus senioris TaxID=931534 RepID=UPI00227EEFD4|nr:YpmS family protein [Lentilactobacillus senioris]MCY9806827.1 YpmS family protein [Lentilactobacillus senioris]
MRSENRQHNPWKWAFWGLISLLVIGVATSFILAFSSAKAPVTQSANQTDTVPTSATLNKKQLNSLVAYYLNKRQVNSTNQYQVKVEDQVIIYGSVKVLGSNVNYSLFLTPKAETNGNVTLKATKLSVGKLQLPISFVMLFIQNNYDLPEWVTMNANKHEIYLDITHMNSDGINYKAKEIDTSGAGKFKFEMLIPNTNAEGNNA